MATTLKAIYEGGALRLLTPLALEEGDTIEALLLERTPYDLTQGKSDARTPLEIVQEISSLSVTSDRVETASTDHDRILYGGPDGAL